MYTHGYADGGYTLFLGFVLVFLTMVGWWLDVVREAVFEGQHTKEVQRGLRQGMILFIVSEAMFFFSFFWAFFHSSVNPTFVIVSWPPAGIETPSPWGLPFLNTLVLLTSGISITWSHHAILLGRFKQVWSGLYITLLLGAFFLSFQLVEYSGAAFSISDSVFGSVFFLITGFHGLHVVIGFVFLFVCLIRLDSDHFTRDHHVGFECAVWYWHFVDVVWLFLFVSVYWWGGTPHD